VQQKSEKSDVSVLKVFSLLNQPTQRRNRMSEQQTLEPRILKINTCASLSGRTSITYHVGCMGARDVCFRVWNTSGKGVFSKEWVAASDIQKVLAQHESLSAPSLLPVFQVGRSVNTAGYLLAVLKEEGLVVQADDEAHKYVRMQSERFVSEAASLIKAQVSLDPVTDAPAVHKTAKGKAGRGAKVPAWEANASGDGSTKE
jgi:hypothetical protein